ncbi:MAG: hypothetical protein GY760_18640 [Deltaproteobacteria bacterium]|nr:hypothetical protein [Deltaproteobacteria bacterium]
MIIISFEFYIERETGIRHIDRHDVGIEEIQEFFNDSVFYEKQREDESFVAYGKVKSGRSLKVVYRKKSKYLYFIITAHDLEDKMIIQFLDEEIE